MTRVPVGKLTAACLALGLGALSVPLQTTTAEAAVARPASFGAVTAKPGSAPGTVTVSWAHDGANTSRYEIETGLTSFSRTDPSLPLHARGSAVFSVPGSQKSITLTPEQTAAAGAPVGSANHLYFRLRAVNTTSEGEASRDYPYLQTVGVAPAVPASTGTPVRVATFNVRTARATTDARTWLERVPDVARSILDRAPGVVAVQELGPGRADGVAGSTGGRPRQTDSLVTTLASMGGERYRLTRTTSYVKPGIDSGTQGMRILYDNDRYRLLSPCVDTSPDGVYSPSCSIKLPLRASGDTENDRRRSAYAQFADRATGERFYVVSVHLDARHSTDVAVERTYDQLRADQMRTTIDAVARENTDRVPVVLGGDINTWQNNKVGYAAHDVLVDQGFYDTAASPRATNLHYTTMNDFATTLTDPSPGFGARLDVVAAKGITGAVSWENVMKPTDSARPSDHNMVVTDLRLPTSGTVTEQTGPTTTTPSPTPSPSPSPVTTPDTTAPDTYRPVSATRIADTRSGAGVPAAPLAAGGTLDVTVAGRAGVPATGVGAVVLNLTSVGARAAGYLTAYPAGAARTSASTLNFSTGTAQANSVVVKVGEGGKVRLYGSAATDVLVDVQGWFPTAARYTALSPARLLDTRTGNGAPAAPVAAGQRIDLTVTGRGGVPASGVAAVVLNLTSTKAADAGHLTAYPAGVTAPSASSLNFVPGRSTANGVVVKVGTGGKVSLRVSAGTDVVADVQGWFPTSSELTPLTPARLLDTRNGTGAPDAPVGAGGHVDLQVTGRGGIPTSGVTAVVLNVTATSAPAAGFVTARPTGTTATSATTLALLPGRSIANRVIVPVGADGRVTLSSTATTELVTDVVGYLHH